MLLYPLVTVLVIMALCEKAFGKSKYVYRWVTVGAFIPAVFDFLKTLPAGIQNALHISALTEFGRRVFPFFDFGLGWVVPALIGLVIGLVLTVAMRGKDKKAAA
jgi:LIVCS family branched-chain amino acid:cation transporter